MAPSLKWLATCICLLAFGDPSAFAADTTLAPLQPAAREPETPVKPAVPAAAPQPSARLPIVPEGFEISLVAAPPLVEYPTLASFDDEGRLYVSEGAIINNTYDVLAKTLTRSIRRLEDTNGDGTFDRSTVFADKMTFPYGGVWHDGALYVASDPTLWRLEDTDGDGVVDIRDVLITGFHSEDHAACMKGGFLGPDGWIYFCGGSRAQKVRRGNRVASSPNEGIGVCADGRRRNSRTRFIHGQCGLFTVSPC